MAGQHDRDRVRTVCLTYGTERGRAPDHGRQFRIADRLSVGDLGQARATRLFGTRVPSSSSGRSNSVRSPAKYSSSCASARPRAHRCRLRPFFDPATSSACGDAGFVARLGEADLRVMASPLLSITTTPIGRVHGYRVGHAALSPFRLVVPVLFDRLGLLALLVGVDLLTLPRSWPERHATTTCGRAHKSAMAANVRRCSVSEAGIIGLSQRRCGLRSRDQSA